MLNIFSDLLFTFYCFRSCVSSIYRKNVLMDLGKLSFKKFDDLPNGMRTLNLFVGSDLNDHGLHVFFNFFGEFLQHLGGAIPLIVRGLDEDENWESQIEDAVHHPLDDERLTDLLKILTDVRIYVIGSSAAPVYVSSTISDAEGNSTWTLNEECFARDSDHPNICHPILVIYVSGLDEIINSCKEGINAMPYKANLLGRSRVLVHELTHGLRLQNNMSHCFKDLVWKRSSAGDWCVELHNQCKKIFTLDRFSKYHIGGHKSVEFLTDAGRVWEHSITHGKAIFQQNLSVVVVHHRSLPEKASYYSFQKAALTQEEVSKIIVEPRDLIKVSREHAEILANNIPPGDKPATYVVCSHALTELSFQCPGSQAWHVKKRSALIYQFK
jgi:hypothetical protein